MNQKLIMMDLYHEINFLVNSTRFFGLGERVGNYLLKSGTYNLMPSISAEFEQDSGQNGGN